MSEIKDQVMKKILNTADAAKLKAVNDFLDGKTLGQRSDNGYLSIEDSLQYLGGINRTTLWKARKTGKLQEFQLGTRKLFKRSDLDKLLTRKRIAGVGNMDTS